jgi:hypothetical protein
MKQKTDRMNERTCNLQLLQPSTFKLQADKQKQTFLQKNSEEKSIFFACCKKLLPEKMVKKKEKIKQYKYFFFIVDIINNY